ncbi:MULTISPECIES: cupin domain-containing protein [unclassified Nocardioides]|uniref:cupin domain-containing protein n=1 Tax=unclassified Nocardioides TaxID=2615069 RepID=UPI000AD2D645|nr:MULTISPECIES: cupin domain-containing protein [unclassified Nocardioides]
MSIPVKVAIAEARDNEPHLLATDVESRVLPSGRALAELWRTGALVSGPSNEPDNEAFPGPDGARLWVLTVPPDGPNTPPFHATPTVDLGFVISGSVTLDVEGAAQLELGPGDAFVQSGQSHRWLNRGTEDVVIGVVVVGVAPTSSS